MVFLVLLTYLLERVIIMLLRIKKPNILYMEKMANQQIHLYYMMRLLWILYHSNKRSSVKTLKNKSIIQY